MKKKLLLILVFLSLLFAGWHLYNVSKEYGAPPYEDPSLDDMMLENIDPFDYSKWKRPDGPIRIGLQAGHWKTNEMPEEQERIKENGGGTTGQGIPEWEVALNIAQETAKILEKEGYVVDIIPSTVPEKYLADVFVSIHADGNLNPIVSGFKVAASQRDITGKASTLANFINESYESNVGFPQDPNVTRNMTRYYAFNFRRYKHAIHPMTPGVIVETGFMTNYREASLLINNPEIPAKGIAEGIIKFVDTLNIE